MRRILGFIAVFLALALIFSEVIHSHGIIPFLLVLAKATALTALITVGLLWIFNPK